MSQTYNLQIEAGATYSVTFQYLDDESIPVDITDYTPTAQLRLQTADTVAVTPTLTKENAAGKVTMSLTATQTTALTAGSYNYGVELHSIVDATVIRLIQGVAYVSEEVVK